jgi:hypothetical protein
MPKHATCAYVSPHRMLVKPLDKTDSRSSRDTEGDAGASPVALTRNDTKN